MVNEKYQDGSPEDEALRIAAVALLYVRDIQKLDEYREYFRKFYIPAMESVVASQTFATRDEPTGACGRITIADGGNTCRIRKSQCDRYGVTLKVRGAAQRCGSRGRGERTLGHNTLCVR
ncbi:MAG: hypothetical protein ACXU86_03560, partial [Archangium sp.]